MPQMMSNLQRKSTIGLSYTMIMCWFFGDVTKTFYFIIKSQPLQFIICGLAQLIVDSLIIYQINIYS